MGDRRGQHQKHTCQPQRDVPMIHPFGDPAEWAPEEAVYEEQLKRYRPIVAQDPFEARGPNRLPLDQICRTIEDELLAILATRSGSLERRGGGIRTP